MDKIINPDTNNAISDPHNLGRSHERLQALLGVLERITTQMANIPLGDEDDSDSDGEEISKTDEGLKEEVVIRTESIDRDLNACSNLAQSRDQDIINLIDEISDFTAIESDSCLEEVLPGIVTETERTEPMEAAGADGLSFELSEMMTEAPEKCFNFNSLFNNESESSLDIDFAHILSGVDSKKNVVKCDGVFLSETIGSEPSGRHGKETKGLEGHHLFVNPKMEVPDSPRTRKDFSSESYFGFDNLLEGEVQDSSMEIEFPIMTDGLNLIENEATNAKNGVTTLQALNSETSTIPIDDEYPNNALQSITSETSTIPIDDEYPNSALQSINSETSTIPIDDEYPNNALQSINSETSTIPIDDEYSNNASLQALNSETSTIPINDENSYDFTEIKVRPQMNFGEHEKKIIIDYNSAFSKGYSTKYTDKLAMFLDCPPTKFENPSSAFSKEVIQGSSCAENVIDDSSSRRSLRNIKTSRGKGEENLVKDDVTKLWELKLLMASYYKSKTENPTEKFNDPDAVPGSKEKHLTEKKILGKLLEEKCRATKYSEGLTKVMNASKGRTELGLPCLSRLKDHFNCSTKPKVSSAVTREKQNCEIRRAEKERRLQNCKSFAAKHKRYGVFVDCESDFLINVSFYHPVEKGYLTYDEKKRLGQAKMAMQLDALGTNTLEELCNNFLCCNDYIGIKELSHPSEYSPTELLYQDAAYERIPSATLLIDDTVYCCPNKENCVNTADIVQKWSESTLCKGVGPFKTGDMTITELKDVTLRFGYPYVYVHLGSCEHLVVFTKSRKLNNEDATLAEIYPLVTNIEVDVVSCRTHVNAKKLPKSISAPNSQYLARFAVINSDRLPEDPMLLCRKCVDDFCYDSKGKKIGNFKLFPFMPSQCAVKNMDVK